MVIVEVDAYKSVEVLNESGSVIRVNEGDSIQFTTEDGVLVQGKLKKISGKGEKTKLQIIPSGGQKEEIWSVLVMAEGSLIVVNDQK